MSVGVVDKGTCLQGKRQEGRHPHLQVRPRAEKTEKDTERRKNHEHAVREDKRREFGERWRKIHPGEVSKRRLKVTGGAARRKPVSKKAASRHGGNRSQTSRDEMGWWLSHRSNKEGFFSLQHEPQALCFVSEHMNR